MPIVISNSGPGSGAPGSGFTQTRTLADAIGRAQNEFKGITLATQDAVDFGQQIYQIVANATYWQWLITQGTPFGTVANQPDYVAVPGDLNRLRDMWIWDDSSTFTPVLPITNFEYQIITNVRSIPRSVSIVNQTTFRLYPTPNQSRPGVDANPGTYFSGPITTGAPGSGGQWLVIFEYYKKPKTLTDPTSGFEFDDEFFPVFMQGYIARVAEFLNDDRAGQWSGRNEKGQFQGTGMWGTFAALLNEQVRNENLKSGQSIYAPWEPLYVDVP